MHLACYDRPHVTKDQYYLPLGSGWSLHVWRYHNIVYLFYYSNQLSLITGTVLIYVTRGVASYFKIWHQMCDAVLGDWGHVIMNIPPCRQCCHCCYGYGKYSYGIHDFVLYGGIGIDATVCELSVLKFGSIESLCLCLRCVLVYFCIFIIFLIYM